MSTSNAKKDLCNVLRYTQELLSFHEKIVFDISTESYAFFEEHAVSGLEGVSLNDDPETWISVKRLRETSPPKPEPVLEDWITFDAHLSPDKAPQLIEKSIVRLPFAEVSEMQASGKISTEQIVGPESQGDEPPEALDVLLYSSQLPEIQSQFEHYFKGPWAEWAEAERPRRRSIEFYNMLYQIHQRMQSLGADNPIEMVFGLGIARWKIYQKTLNIPLIEQLVEIEMDEAGTLYVRPRNTTPMLVLKAFHALEIEGSKHFQKEAAPRFEAMVNDPDIGFSPFDRITFDPILRMAAAKLSSRGLYVPDDPESSATRVPPKADDTLRITNTWVLYVRQRIEDFRREDIQRLIDAVEKTNDEACLPQAALKFVTPPSKESVYGNIGFDLGNTHFDLPNSIGGWQDDFGQSSSGGGIENSDSSQKPNYFFPLAFNDEQIEIIRRLDHEDTAGVVVQGPPGTGKTHTIANIICHYLATGRRVLVTAKTPEALTAVQSKLPESIQSLAIAVIHNDREGGRQLERAVNVLAHEAKQIDVAATVRDIDSKQRRLAELEKLLEQIDIQLRQQAERNLKPVSFQGQEILPMDLAKQLVEQRDRYRWFEDELTLEPQHEPGFGEAVDEIRSLRAQLGSDLVYHLEDYPSLEALPEASQILAAHAELGRLTQLEQQISEGDLPIMALDSDAALEEARALREWVQEFAQFYQAIEAESWLLRLYQIFLGDQKTDPLIWPEMEKALDEWIALHEEGRSFRIRGISLPEIELTDVAFDRALEKLAQGKNPFGLMPALFKSRLRQKINEVLHGGQAPKEPQQWQEVLAYRRWTKTLDAFGKRWQSIAKEFEAPTFEDERNARESAFFRLGALIAQLKVTLASLDDKRASLSRLFPYGVDPKKVLHEGCCEDLQKILTVHLDKAETIKAQVTRDKLLALAGNKSLPFHTDLREFAENLGNEAISAADIFKLWQALNDEARRLADLQPLRARLEDLVEQVAQAGASRWAEKLSREPVEADRPDPWTPSDWLDAWYWSRGQGFIRTIGDREFTQRLTEQRAEAEAEQKRLFLDVVRLRTFLGLKKNLSARIETALAKFVSAVAKLGKGTGKTAARYRRMIREASLDAAGGVPCWILPEWRVSEQLPPELNAFDLVIIDEASQSDVTALPEIMRGKKVLIVGDDKQVSPLMVGIDDRKVVQLRTTYLTGLPFGDQMEPITSLYDLGSMVFPGKAILLREHFRCVEPIIRFSSRFYDNALIPFRIPTATERLDPPLVDIYIPHGRRAGDINEAEVEVVVREITKLTQDPAFRHRTIGVISLIGDKQAKRIYDRLISKLGTEVVERHHITCGNASTFQGQERDIMFLSMVACPETASAQTGRMYEQRFNVALSRARDRMVLVRSVAKSQLRPNDLKHAVIEHFENPMGSGKTTQSKDILDLCESEFERNFGRRLIDLGYRIRPQVQVGGYRIDFVVEGANDRRLAIELDGDKYHGPLQWAQDLKRQKALERLGWTFWRCWGSNWISDPEGCLLDLKSTMDRLGIEPIGGGSVQEIYTEWFVEKPPADQMRAA
jgi:very-short-patch-repair endonuclease